MTIKAKNLPIGLGPKLCPQCGHDWAESLISFLHSGQLISDIELAPL